MFGVNAELLIDHAWGYEPVTMDLVKAYKPESSSIGSGQVLECPYDFEGAKLIVREMTDLLVLDLVEKRLVTDQMVLTIGYDVDNLTDPKIKSGYRGEVTVDHYGRKVPKHAHGSVNLEHQTSSTQMIMDGVMELYERIVNPDLLVRRVTIAANRVVDEKKAGKEEHFEQMDLFTDYEALARQRMEQEEKFAKERKLQEAMLSVKRKYGKNAILKGMNLQEGARTMERNNQIGGHKA